MDLTKRLAGRTFLPLLVAAGFGAACVPTAGLADMTVVDSTRINIDIDYNKMTGWDLGAHDELADIAYEADEVLFYANMTARRTVPDDPDFAFLGAAPGETYWVLPMVFDPARLSVGVSTESIEDDTFASYFEADSRVHSTGPWVKLSFKEVRGPGRVSVWQNDAFGRPIVWMATAGEFTEDNAVFVLATRDADYNWAFTATGIYEVDVVASAFLPGEDHPVCSDVVTYTFGVEATES
jgi:surface-anchored protein